MKNMRINGERLWAVAREGKAGRLWSSADGRQWLKHERFTGGEPHSVHAIAGAVYVAGSGSDGRGILWGPKGHSLPPAQEQPEPLPVQYPVEGKKPEPQLCGPPLAPCVLPITT